MTPADDRPPFGGAPSGPEHTPDPPASYPPPIPPPVPPSSRPAPPPLPGYGPPPAALPEVRFGDAGRPIVLRPMGVGAMLDTAINLYRRNYRTLMGIVAFVVVPYTFLQAFVLRDNTPTLSFDPSSVNEPSGSTGAFTALFLAGTYLLIAPFLTAAVARATSEVYLGGRPTVQETYRFALPRIVSILWVTFLGFLAVAGGVLLLIVGAVLFYVRFYFSSTVVVVEGKRGTQALARSWRLARGSFWRIFGTILLAWLLTQIVTTVIVGVFLVVGTLANEHAWLPLAVGQSLAQVLAMPFSAMIAVLLYFDLRIRKEGFDLALMAQELKRDPGGA